MFKRLSLLRGTDLTLTSKLLSWKCKVIAAKYLQSLNNVKDYLKMRKLYHLKILWPLQVMSKLFSTLLIMRKRKRRMNQAINSSNFFMILKIIPYINLKNIFPWLLLNTRLVKPVISKRWMKIVISLENGLEIRILSFNLSLGPLNMDSKPNLCTSVFLGKDLQ